MRKKFFVLFGLTVLLSLVMGIPAFASSNDVAASAAVTKIPGNTNILTITVIDDNGTYTEDFNIRNNAKGTYSVGNYSVFVSTYGNDKVDKCYIQNVALDMDGMDMTKPYSETFNLLDDNGKPTLLELSFEPVPQIGTRAGSTVGSASPGVFTTSYSNYEGTKMSYRFDITLYGQSQWAISNGRDLTCIVSMPFTTINSRNLNIGRSVCTNTLPAEITGSMNWTMFNTSWGALGSYSGWVRTSIEWTSKLTISWN